MTIVNINDNNERLFANRCLSIVWLSKQSRMDRERGIKREKDEWNCYLYPDLIKDLFISDK